MKLIGVYYRCPDLFRLDSLHWFLFRSVHIAPTEHYTVYVQCTYFIVRFPLNFFKLNFLYNKYFGS